MDKSISIQIKQGIQRIVSSLQIRLTQKKRHNIRSIFLKGLVVLIVLLGLSRFVIPTPHFSNPTSTVLEAEDGSLLSARIAKDGQWRFPPIDSVPDKFEACLLHFEDRSFYHHPGINPKAVARAMKVNLKAGKVVQGGSTLTMQIARMLGDKSQRSFINKLKEALLAIHLEINYGKEELLEIYASNAPFGGNVVGLETAAWRYYSRSPEELSWAESATLAVLPNAPSLIYPGRGQEKLKEKRNRLLRSMQDEGIIPLDEYEMAVLEQLPIRPENMPDYAIHLMDRYVPSQEGERIRTSVEHELQHKAQSLLNAHVQGMESIEVYNGALIILDTQTGDVLAYVGNANYTQDHANAVDCIKGRRSTGSILKPIIYAEMLDAGELTPALLIEDTPIQFSDYSPENYYGDFDGAVPANEALYRSLNIPFVRLLREYGVARFMKNLRELGLSSINHSADHYGLSLMLGGAEVQLDELSQLYAAMGANLIKPNEAYPLNRWSIHHTFNAMTELTRPEGREYQRAFSSSRTVAWKTGTSFGNKDAWAIGVTPDYTIGVWIGNADGEGRAGLTGVSSAAPLLFDAFDLLPAGQWFDEPLEAGASYMELCSVSGRIKSSECPNSVFYELAAKDYSSVGNCNYHQTLYLTEDLSMQGMQGCTDRALHPEPWFILSPIQEHYYQLKHSEYKPLPPVIPSCEVVGGAMEFIYPQRGMKMYIPKDLDGEKSRVICKLVHRDKRAEVHWYLNKEYLGATSGVHEMPILSDKGIHTLLAVDEKGFEIALDFEVLSPKE